VESYGTPRAAVLVTISRPTTTSDFNGVILLSAILNSIFRRPADSIPASTCPISSRFRAYAATAWYHNKLPRKKPTD